MKRILIIVLAMMMLLSCVACSNNNTTDPTDGTKPSVNDTTNPTNPGQTDNTSPTKPTSPSTPPDVPKEEQPPVAGDDFVNEDSVPFDTNDARKLYLENKYGVTASFVPNISNEYVSYFTLEGYSGVFTLWSKEQLAELGADEKCLQHDFVDNAYFTIEYAQVYQYFANAISETGVKIDRLIVEYNGRWPYIYDASKSFAECLSSTDDAKLKKFNIYVYGTFSEENNAINIVDALDALDCNGSLRLYQVVEDISSLSNADLMSTVKSYDYVKIILNTPLK